MPHYIETRIVQENLDIVTEEVATHRNVLPCQELKQTGNIISVTSPSNCPHSLRE